MGLARSARARIRTAAARAIGGKTQGRCVEVVLAILRGLGGDPGPAALAAHGVELHDAFAHFDLLLLPWLRRRWVRHLAHMRNPAPRWSQAVGPIGGIIASLFDAG